MAILTSHLVLRWASFLAGPEEERQLGAAWGGEGRTRDPTFNNLKLGESEVKIARIFTATAKNRLLEGKQRKKRSL